MPDTLLELEILALDCQATGANPTRGHLLEMGWVRTRASLKYSAEYSDVRSYLIRLPDDAGIPRAVRRITGISEENLQSALSPGTAWQLLLAAAGIKSSDHPEGFCPAVIHFARFEQPFLQALHHRGGYPDQFPFQIICTHEIAMRLLPDLPRKGLRAIAGYFGHSMPEFKRCRDHAAATAFVWQNVVRLLETTCGITELGQLMDWLASDRPRGRSKRVYPMDPAIRQQLPDSPGVYRMRREGGSILYIGKAKSIKQRVNSYFRSSAPHAEHILEMLTQARELDFTRTGSALEAAILESDEIKHCSPPYNIALRRRQRRLAFCTKDLTRHAAIAGDEYTVGPLPAGRTTEALAALGSWFKDGLPLEGDPDKLIGYSIFAMPPEYGPEIDCLAEGLKIFKDRYRSRLESQTPLRFLTALGAALWQEKLEAQAAAGTEETDQDDLEGQPELHEKPVDMPVWTPEAAAGAMEAMIRHSAHLIRRARWFRLLSDSALVWTSCGPSGQKESLLVIENGAVVRQGKLNVQAGIVHRFQTGYSIRKRQNNIDLKTYDRLRVITTELRRIISEDRRIKLHLGPKVILNRPALKKVLRWV